MEGLAPAKQNRIRVADAGFTAVSIRCGEWVVGKEGRGRDEPEGGGGVCTDLDVWVDSRQNRREVWRVMVTGDEFTRASVLAGPAWQVGGMKSGQSTGCRGTRGGVWSRWYCDHSPACGGTGRGLREEAEEAAGWCGWKTPVSASFQLK